MVMLRLLTLQNQTLHTRRQHLLLRLIDIIYNVASLPPIFLATNNPIVTAGLTCAPDLYPIAYIIAVSTNACTNPIPITPNCPL
jgi:hypothetical protein